MGRSWWGWGLDEEAVQGQEARELERAVRSFLPEADLTVHDAPAVGSLGLARPRVVVPESLAHVCSVAPVERVAHARGKALRDVVRNLEGVVGPVPDVVAFPEGEADLERLLDWCSGANLAVIAYGGGSSVVGGVEPRVGEGFAGVVTVDLSRMRRVLEVDAVSGAASVQAGVLGPDLEGQLRPHGWSLRHFPQSFEFSSLGGWLATRAGGHFATGPTRIDAMVESLRVVTPAGVAESARVPSSGAGPSPDGVFLGSEGTLGVITQAWMQLRERPRWRSQTSVVFDRFFDGVAAVRALARSGLEPANCRLLDAAEALINAGTSVRGGLLVVGLESADHPQEAAMERVVALCADHGGRVGRVRHSDEAGGGGGREERSARWRSAFVRMPYQRDALVRRSVLVETFETACTWGALEGLHARVVAAAQEAIGQVCGGQGVVTCRLTHAYRDGAAPYFGVYAQGRWGSMVEQWDEIKARVSSAIAECGGTITHHHAVGRDHMRWYAGERPGVFAAGMGALKREVDPAGVLNPGVLWPAGAG
ncbi:FAD-binding oxidoreductase [Nocardiopsis sp. HNM0947]|uniref:FAD-binding oxidoreductase n=1 Tax=Nocardiopsis coralli TaxID=2772213 RepID=A0ABR9P6I5_9ACTN|nr:FAD-binding oxidoreductase [Nocardiopsis coralli]MBE2999452.1 FAD-binding oxidoreductase [Nocardiopsis coralli]